MAEEMKNEIMNEEELDQVAGGSWGESVRDFNNAFTRKIPGFEKIDPMSTEGIKYMLQNWTEGDNIVGKLKGMFYVRKSRNRYDLQRQTF